MVTSKPIPTINESESSLIYRDYIEFVREPFEDENFEVFLQNGRHYTLTIWDYRVVLKRLGVTIPELVIDALFNFNDVLWFPKEQRIELL
jgi:hypothetical protein